MSTGATAGVEVYDDPLRQAAAAEPAVPVFARPPRMTMNALAASTSAASPANSVPPSPGPTSASMFAPTPAPASAGSLSAMQRSGLAPPVLLTAPAQSAKPRFTGAHDPLTATAAAVAAGSAPKPPRPSNKPRLSVSFATPLEHHYYPTYHESLIAPAQTGPVPSPPTNGSSYIFSAMGSLFSSLTSKDDQQQGQQQPPIPLTVTTTSPVASSLPSPGFTSNAADGQPYTPQWYVSMSRKIDQQNLFMAFKLSVKDLIACSIGTVVADSSDSLMQFCNVFEKVLLHGFLGVRSMFFGMMDTRDLYSVVTGLAQRMPIPELETCAEHARTSRGRFRVWLRMTLMSRKLSLYIQAALNDEAFMREYYEPWALIRSEHASVIAGSLLGLNPIDFSLCLKDQHFDYEDAIIVDYARYLRRVRADSVPDHRAPDLIRLDEISNKDKSGPTPEALRIAELEEDARRQAKQMEYVEELAKQRLQQYETEHHKKLVAEEEVCALHNALMAVREEKRMESRDLEKVVLELQQQLDAANQEMSRLRAERRRPYTERSRYQFEEDAEGDFVNISSDSIPHNSME